MFIFIFLLVRTVTTQNYETVITCEDLTANIQCSTGEVIEIIHASYGRSNYATCLHPSIKTDQCTASTSLSTVKSSCDGQQTCTVRASNSVFGDPCVYTYKYLNVTYTCQREPQRVITCEDRTANLQCPPGSFIRIIKAIYGRSNYNTCPHPSIKTDQCAATTSFSRVQSSCEGQQTCSVRASNSVFGDPCVYTYKYLDVTFSCEKGHHIITCEDSTANLQCPSGSVIRIIKAAYGRSNYYTCPHPSIKTDQCAATTSLSRVQSSCEGQQTCSVRASNSVFGDPCVYTYKYLEVTFSCEREAVPEEPPTQ